MTTLYGLTDDGILLMAYRQEASVGEIIEAVGFLPRPRILALES